MQGVHWRSESIYLPNILENKLTTSVVISSDWINNNTSRNGTGIFQSVTKCDNSEKITFTMTPAIVSSAWQPLPHNIYR